VVFGGALEFSTNTAILRAIMGFNPRIDKIPASDGLPHPDQLPENLKAAVDAVSPVA
jgi:hypothetical protein